MESVRGGKHQMLLVGALLSVSCAASTKESVPTSSASSLNADLELMATWFGGHFNNYAQIVEEEDQKTPKDYRHYHIHSIFEPIELPALAKHVYYVEQTMGGPGGRPYRQRVYTLTTDPVRNAVILSIYKIDEPKSLLGSYERPEVWKTFDAARLSILEGCEIVWRRNGEHFDGTTVPGQCKVESKFFKTTLHIEDQLYLDDDEIWIGDEAKDPTGKLVYGHPDGVPHKLQRARQFTGWALRSHADEGGEPDLIRGLKIHDQGQRLVLKTADGTPLGYEIELAQLTYTKTNTRILKLAVYKPGEKRALMYTWANPEAKRIGVNLRYMQVGLTLADEVKPGPRSDERKTEESTNER